MAQGLLLKLGKYMRKMNTVVCIFDVRKRIVMSRKTFIKLMKTLIKIGQVNK